MQSVISATGVEVSVSIARGGRIDYVAISFADRQETWFELSDARLLARTLHLGADQSGADYLIRGSDGTVRVTSGDVEGEQFVTLEWSAEVDDLVDLTPSEARKLARAIRCASTR